MQKKLFSAVLVTVLAISLLAGCGKNNKADNASTPNLTEQTTEAKKEQTVSNDKANIKGNLGDGVALDCAGVGTDTEEYKAVEEYLKDTDAIFEMYDINLLDKSKNKVQPNGTVEVSVKLSDAMKNADGDVYVVFYNKDKEFTKIDAAEKDGYVTFKTTHFSIYAVVKGGAKVESAAGNTTSEEQNAAPDSGVSQEVSATQAQEKVVAQEPVTQAPVQEHVTEPEQTQPEKTEQPDTSEDNDGVDYDKIKEAEDNPNAFSFISLDQVMYVTRATKVRTGPDGYFEVLETYPKGKALRILGQCVETGWYLISYDYNGVGFISGNDLSLNHVN